MVDRESHYGREDTARGEGHRRSSRHGRPRRATRRRAAPAAKAPTPRLAREAKRPPRRRDSGRHRSVSAGAGPRGTRLLRAAIAGLVLVAVLGVVGYSAFRLMGEWPSTSRQIEPGLPVHVVIEQGSTTAAIAGQLAELGVIDSAFMFRLKVRDTGAGERLKAGEYDLATGMAYEDVIERLTAGAIAEYVDVTIPEGFTAEQVAARMAAQAGVPADEMLRLCTTGADEFVADHPYLEGAHNGSLEGFLYPATYSIEPGTQPREIVEMMLGKFDREVAVVDLSYAETRGLDLVDVVVIASILEREARLEDEFPLVSSVIYNRLARPMKLQLCATVMYTMPDGTTALTTKDLEQETPYNTYLHDGLPAGPISNPGMRALQAAARPAETDYLYYVLTGADGSQTFTATYDEFLEAKRRGQAALGN